MAKRNVTRRTVLKGAMGFQLGVYLTPMDRLAAIVVGDPSAGGPGGGAGGPPGDPAGAADGAAQGPAAEPIALGAWIRVGADDAVTITVSKSEMGQGVRTSLAMIVAEELDADWSKVRVHQAPAGTAYGSQTTVGSSSVSSMWTPLRTAGATARAMLVAAAAQTWGVAADACRTEPGAVVHPPSARRLTYGALAEAASKQPVPPSGQVRLKAPGEFRIVGQPTSRVDNLEVVTGKAVYGIDVRLPGMLHAVVARCPVFGGRVARFDDTAAKAVPGVRHVVRINAGIAVVGDTTWAAMAGRDALEITWDEGGNAGLTSDQIRRSLEGAIPALPALPPGAAKVVEARYEVPYLAHAPMEPMNCVADVRADRCVVYAPTQSPGAQGGAQGTAANALGRPASAVEVQVTLMGGGFGRRAGNDYVTEAVQISQAIGTPVQLTWTRADDMQRDYYRPASIHTLRGALDAGGRITAWQHHGAMATRGGAGNQARPPYDVPSPALNIAGAQVAVPTGAWRSVASSQIVFANESFIDELAAAADRDPFEFRRERLAGNRRLLGVLELAADKAGWGGSLPAGHGRGIACMAGFGSYIAVVAEVSVAADGQVRARRMVAAVDCGIAVNPRTIEAQIQGAIVDGLSTALKAEITIDRGRAVQSSFWDYEWFRMGDMPAVEVHIVPSTAQPGGIGETGYPATPPAVANAIFAATGKRVRRLPIRAADLATGTVPPATAVPPTPTRPPASPTPRPATPTTGVPTGRKVYLPAVERP